MVTADRRDSERDRLSRIAWRSGWVLALAAVTFGCSDGGATGAGDELGYGPAEATAFTYEVRYGEPSIPGEAEVTYTNADGETVTETVDMPWESESIAVRDGESYRVEATGTPRDDASFGCGVNTDNGWHLGNSDMDATCSYTFPDDLEDDD